MMCMCGAHKGHSQHVQIGGIILLLVGLVYVAQSMGWVSWALPNFWAVLLVLFGLFTAGCAKCYEG